MEFFNTGLVLVIGSFTGMQKFFGSSDVNQDNLIYQGFESKWYMNVSKILLNTLFISSYLSNMIDMKNFGLWYFK